MEIHRNFAAFLPRLITACGREAEKIMLPMQPGDVPVTYADTSKLERETGFRPATPLRTGVERFVRWFEDWKKTI